MMQTWELCVVATVTEPEAGVSTVFYTPTGVDLAQVARPTTDAELGAVQNDVICTLLANGWELVSTDYAKAEGKADGRLWFKRPAQKREGTKYGP